MTDIATGAGSREDLESWLLEWIGDEFDPAELIYGPAGTAARVMTQVHPTFLERHLAQGGSSYLRDMCLKIRDTADLTESALAREERAHGHHGRGGPRRNVTGRAAA